MEEKLTDNIEENDEDIPTRDQWEKYHVDTLKADFCSWIDLNAASNQLIGSAVVRVVVYLLQSFSKFSLVVRSTVFFP